MCHTEMALSTGKLDSAFSFATLGARSRGRLASLGALGTWFFQNIEAEPDGTVEEKIPAWWDPNRPVVDSGSERQARSRGNKSA